MSVRRFEDVFLETPVYFLLVALRDTYLLWVGSVPPRLDHMAVAVPTRFVRPSRTIAHSLYFHAQSSSSLQDAQPSASTILGDPTLASAQQEFTLSVAKHLGMPLPSLLRFCSHPLPTLPPARRQEDRTNVFCELQPQRLLAGDADLRGATPARGACICCYVFLFLFVAIVIVTFHAPFSFSSFMSECVFTRVQELQDGCPHRESVSLGFVALVVSVRVRVLVVLHIM